MSARKWFTRTVRKDAVRIEGVVYSSRCDLHGVLDGRRLLFARYPDGEKGWMPFINMWGTEAYANSQADPDTPEGKAAWAEECRLFAAGEPPVDGLNGPSGTYNMVEDETGAWLAYPAVVPPFWHSAASTKEEAPDA